MIIPWRQKASLGVSVRNRNDVADYDYLENLSPLELKWLKGFNREYVNADFKHKYKKLHKNKKLKKDCYSRNNSRNRDLYSQLKVYHLLYLVSSVSERNNFKDWNYEDIMIELLDND